MPSGLMALAEVHAIDGQPKQGLHQVAEAARIIEATKERWAEAEMHRLRGMLLLSMNDHSAAEESYREAIAVARGQNAKFWELRAVRDLARLFLDKGQRAEAQELLSPVHQWFTQGFDAPDLQEAGAVLARLA
ncbi:MAG: tetratricopeptide repeat protein [Gammaproteobacteria bacterium]|nr:tetratricopeptide repeat protein [Gammaproteobacteria bacterium]